MLEQNLYYIDVVNLYYSDGVNFWLLNTKCLTYNPLTSVYSLHTSFFYQLHNALYYNIGLVNTTPIINLESSLYPLEYLTEGQTSSGIMYFF